uniref:Uncharacterized protein n=1 Tax=Anguilla anguilla TaxID=7936 RepID=A0A0E9QYV8_ANGAN
MESISFNKEMEFHTLSRCHYVCTAFS